MTHSHNPESAIFCTMKGTKRDMEIILMVFLFRFIQSDSVIFTQTFFVLNFGSFLSFLLILHNKSGQGHGSFTGCFLRKNLIWSILIILGFFRSTVRLDLVKIEADHCYCVRYLNGQGMNYFMITTGFLNSQDMMKILKQSRHDFSARHLCDGHCMDIR